MVLREEDAEGAHFSFSGIVHNALGKPMTDMLNFGMATQHIHAGSPTPAVKWSCQRQILPKMRICGKNSGEIGMPWVLNETTPNAKVYAVTGNRMAGPGVDADIITKLPSLLSSCSQLVHTWGVCWHKKLSRSVVNTRR